MQSLKNPALPGKRYDYQHKVFSHPGVKFPTTGLFRNYAVYNTPDEHYGIERTVDLSSFLKYFPQPEPNEWPFDGVSHVPLFGHLYVPKAKPAVAAADEKYPLAIFCHGDWGVETDSAAGYAYLAELLASHGVLSASVTATHIAQLTWDENEELYPDSGKRPILILEYIKQFRLWNADPVHPLYQKIDLERIFLCGHSRGGEAVTDASYINTQTSIPGLPGVAPFPDNVPLDGGENGLGPYGFNLKAVLTMAPGMIDGKHQGDRKPYGAPNVMNNYFHIEGTFDHTNGHVYYDAANRNLKNPQLSNGKIKGLWRIYGGNHSYFNDVWTNAIDNPKIKQEQQLCAKLYVVNIVQALLLDSPAHRELLKDHKRSAAWLPEGRQLVSQYQDDCRLFLQHHQEPAAPLLPQVSLPLRGSIQTSSNLTAQRQRLNFDPGTLKAPFYRLKLRWQAGSVAPTYSLLFKPIADDIATDAYTVLAMTFGQRLAEAGDAAQDQDIAIEVVDTSGKRATFKLSKYHSLLYPDNLKSTESDSYYTVQMQTVRVPLEDLLDDQTHARLNVRRLQRITFTFDKTVSAVVYNSGIELSC